VASATCSRSHERAGLAGEGLALPAVAGQPGDPADHDRGRLRGRAGRARGVPHGPDADAVVARPVLARPRPAGGDGSTAAGRGLDPGPVVGHGCSRRAHHLPDAGPRAAVPRRGARHDPRRPGVRRGEPHAHRVHPHDQCRRRALPGRRGADHRRPGADPGPVPGAPGAGAQPARPGDAAVRPRGRRGSRRRRVGRGAQRPAPGPPAEEGRRTMESAAARQRHSTARR